MKKQILYLLAALAFVPGFVSCEDDDDEDVNPILTETTSYTGTLTVNYEGADVNTDSVTLDVIPESGMKTVTILFNKVKFVPQMPVSLDISVPGVTAEESGDKIILSGENIVPIAMKQEFALYTVTGLTGTIENGTLDLSLNFGQYATSFTGSNN
jgi:hypothetical protein